MGPGSNAEAAPGDPGAQAGRADRAAPETQAAGRVAPAASGAQPNPAAPGAGPNPAAPETHANWEDPAAPETQTGRVAPGAPGAQPNPAEPETQASREDPAAPGAQAGRVAPGTQPNAAAPEAQTGPVPPGAPGGQPPAAGSRPATPAARATQPAAPGSGPAGPAAASLRSELRVFAGFPGPWLIASAFVAAFTLRLALGGWTWPDLIVAAAVLAFEPFTEWLIHVLLLHFRPHTIRGRTIDPLIARKHREHHADPKDRALVLVPLPVLVVGIALDVPLVLLVPEPRLLLTGLAVGYAMLLTYEWTHHLIHSAYRPRHRYYRSIWRSHRLHHFRNERYWFGVTINLADHVLGTFPEREAVPLSSTARTLGVGTP